MMHYPIQHAVYFLFWKLAGMIKEAATDADNYSIEFNQDANLGAPEKLSLIGAQLLTDYMIFDGNTEKCKWTNDGK